MARRARSGVVGPAGRAMARWAAVRSVRWAAVRWAAVRWAAVGAVAITVSGCSLASHPTARRGAGTGRGAAAATVRTSSPGSATAPVAAGVARANRTHEYPTPVPREHVVGAWRTPVAAVRAFATTYINWTAATVPGRMRALAQVSIGQARSAVTLAAAQTAGDSELRGGGIANSGTVQAIAPVTGERNGYAVVTRERTTATADDAYRGLRPAWHVTVATVTRIAGGLWVVSGWQPES